ncbi:hypothetical protein MTO96_046162, partial [Rhipicephalus appendiculatus]
CVTYINLDLVDTIIERYVMWHALKNSAVGVKRFDYKQNSGDVVCPMPSTESFICCEAIASLKNLTFLSISGVYFSYDVARIIGGYVEQAASLANLELLNIEADDTSAGLFLDHLARNRTVKSLHVHEHILLAREGRALADVVLNHGILEEVTVKGARSRSPSALLAAAAQSRSLRSLTVQESFIDAADIEAMASSLMIPSLPPDFDPEVMRPPPLSPLRKVSFKECVLVELTLYECGLGEVFAPLAAERLLHDRRLRLLNVEMNNFSIYSIKSMIEVLQANKTLKTLVVNMRADHPQEDVSSLFDMIPHLMLTMVHLPDADVVILLRALESNRTIYFMTFNGITFNKRNAKALGRLVERNRTFVCFTVDLRQSDAFLDRMVQFHNILRELKEALRRNSFIMHVRVHTETSDPSNDPAIKDACRQNSALMNEAIRFVNGAMDKTAALAFETLQHCQSVTIRMYWYGDMSEESALKKIAEARERLALNYFALAGVVKAEIVCQRNPKAKKKVTLLDSIGRVMQARICSYLSLTDVVDI